MKGAEEPVLRSLFVVGLLLDIRDALEGFALQLLIPGAGDDHFALLVQGKHGIHIHIQHGFAAFLLILVEDHVFLDQVHGMQGLILFAVVAAVGPLRASP